MKPFSGRRQFLQGTLALGCALCTPATMVATASPKRKYYCAYGAASVGEPNNLIELKQAAVEKLKVLLENRSKALIEYIESEDKLVPDFFGSAAPIFYDPGTHVTAYTNIDRAFIALGEGFLSEYARERMLSV